MSDTPLGVHTAAVSPAAPTALISYAHEDGPALVDELECELRLRGIRVKRDVETFRAGRALTGEIAEGIDADLVLGRLGPAALQSQAVIERELRPALHAYARLGRPLVVLAPDRIGTTRAEIDAAIGGRLPYSAQATWAPAPAAGQPMSEYAAEVARGALRSLYGHARGVPDGCWQMLLLSRGSPRHGDGLVLDATGLTGGPLRRVGSTADWARIKTAIDDVASTLGTHCARRTVTITPNAHFSAGFLFGHAFNLHAQWRLHVTGSHGHSTASRQRTLKGIHELRVDGPPQSSELFVGVDLAGRDVTGALDRLCTERGSRPALQLVYERHSSDTDMSANEIADAASAIAVRIKAAIDERRPARLDLFVAAPSALPVLLGSEMSTVGLPIGLWEHDDTRYVHTLDIGKPQYRRPE